MATNPAVPPAASSQLTLCDRAPIHLCGSIQPRGLLLLLVADAMRLTVIAGAGPIEDELVPD